MRMVVFCHPTFLGSTSMPLFADMLSRGLRARGHSVLQWSPAPWFHRIPAPRGLRKWLGYLDQFLVFPAIVRWRLRHIPKDTLFVFADQALGPWVPLVRGRPHVIHCHDLLALRSALGEIPRNPVSGTGKLYQRWIRRGFRRGRNFVSVSERTRSELHRLMAPAAPALSDVVHNGLHREFAPLSAKEARERFTGTGLAWPGDGYLLHVGGNGWYKNRAGVLAIYRAYVRRVTEPRPLLMVGAEPTQALLDLASGIPRPGIVQFLVRPTTDVLEAAYSAASVLVFPSHAEGFGWPIIEAMACGCPVLTTADAPMTEVGGEVARYLPLPDGLPADTWAGAAVDRLLDILDLDQERRDRLRAAGITRARQFSTDRAIEGYLAVYTRIMDGSQA